MAHRLTRHKARRSTPNVIHALPGMGADHRMFPAPWTDLPNFRADDWVRYSGEETLADVADSMCKACGIQDGDALVGASLGGMVACEIAKIRKIPSLFLVGSAVHPDEISKVLAALHPLAQVAPIEWLRLSAGSIPLELAQMFASIDAPFVRAMCSAIFKWQGLGATSTKVHRIHGRFDLVIPPPDGADLLLNGGHLISITHAEKCAGYVLRHSPNGTCVSSTQPKPSVG